MKRKMKLFIFTCDPYEKISYDLIWFYLISRENHLIFWFLILFSDFSDENIIFSYELVFFSHHLRCSSDFLYDFSFSDEFSCTWIWSQIIRWLSHTTCILRWALIYILGIPMWLPYTTFRCLVGKSFTFSKSTK